MNNIALSTEELKEQIAFRTKEELKDLVAYIETL